MNGATTKDFFGIRLETRDGEKWWIKDISQRKEIGIYGTYTLKEWEIILKKMDLEKKKTA